MAFTNVFDYPSGSDVLEMGNNVDSDVLGASARQSRIAFTYPSGPTGYSEDLALSSASDGGPFPTHPGSVPDNVAPIQSTSEALESLDFFRVFQGPGTGRSPYPETEQKTQKKPPPSSQSPTPASKKRPRKVRKQNRSCDSCRSAKRACDLPPNASLSDNLPLSPCSMCKLRGTACTIAWRSTKQASRNTKDPASNTFVKSYIINHDPDAIEHANDGLSSPSPTALPSHDCTLVCRTMASQTCFQKLGVYIYMFDNPMSNLLSKKCMPPRYSLGIAAIMPLRCNTQLASQFNQTESSITNAWGTRPPSQPPTPTSRLFFAASILDILFERPSSRSEPIQFMPRDVALTETYKWVAIATGSQFLVDGSSADNKKRPYQEARDLAYATWCKAKHMVFENIAASKSFRLGLTLLLFGTILPPTGTDRSDDFREEAAYALYEGIRRLRMLCVEARSCLQLADTCSHIIAPMSGPHKPMNRQCRFQKLSPDAHGDVVELIAAFEWLSEVSESVAITLSPSGRLSVGPSFNNISSESSQVEDFFVGKPDVKNADNSQSLKRIDDGVIARVKAVTRPVTKLWTQGSVEQRVLDAVLESGSLVAIMWKALARFTIATQSWGTGYITDAKIHEDFNTMIMLIDLWRTTFGTIDCDSAKSLHLSPTNVRRSVTFCATDGDLAILLFYKLCGHLQKTLEDQPQRPCPGLCETLKVTKNNRDNQRLTSAMQLFYLASANFQVSGPGFQENCGLKANVEYIRAHPHPSMVVQAYQLASEGLAQEIQNSVSTIDLKRISVLSTALECCLRELQGLQNALIMYPAP
ncbi:hypothetical protein BDV24DRAFT_159982 [Aspergillus arachidicola]|uniref:Zn(2)-C6 fungal-type domain-containing protein n=1 Tax=Aspergillus arachidicola TaxID=656916 RepID=A0A5N6YI85_9EURO|nr:hypothetical protein BDV24DRAFT_159982 [Aspergillus arachidicola]